MFHDVTIQEVRPEGEGAVCVTFAAEADMAWKPGQYLTLKTEIEGAEVRRSYSIASQPGGALCVGIRAVPEGLFSTFAQTLRAGQTLQVMPPQGRFVWSGQRRILLVAAGSGITPMVSIAAAALAEGAEVTLIYGNRDTAHIMFRDTLDALKDQYLDRFTLIHVLSREPQDVALLNGRISGDKVAALARAGAVDLQRAEAVFLCGPGAMIDDVADVLSKTAPSVPVLHERFFTEETGARPERSAKADQVAEDGVTVSVTLDGATRQFTLTGQDDTVLDAAARSGYELPFSCKGGMCCTCRCKVVDGSAEMALNYSLEPWEIAAGFTLACQARPTSQTLVLDFDAA